MTARARTVALCDKHAAAQMAPFRKVVTPVDVTDAEQFPEIARAIAGLAAMSPERRAQLEKEWE